MVAAASLPAELDLGGPEAATTWPPGGAGRAAARKHGTSGTGAGALLGTYTTLSSEQACWDCPASTHLAAHGGAGAAVMASLAVGRIRKCWSRVLAPSLLLLVPLVATAAGSASAGGTAPGCLDEQRVFPSGARAADAWSSTSPCGKQSGVQACVVVSAVAAPPAGTP